MESVSSEVCDTKSRNNEDAGEARSKWRCEYEVIGLLFKVLFIYCVFETGSLSKAQPGLKLMIPLSIMIIGIRGSADEWNLIF